VAEQKKEECQGSAGHGLMRGARVVGATQDPVMNCEPGALGVVRTAENVNRGPKRPVCPSLSVPRFPLLNKKVARYVATYWPFGNSL
jgi:hypothetical protein